MSEFPVRRATSKPKRGIGTGFLRAWIVLSVLWIGFVALAGGLAIADMPAESRSDNIALAVGAALAPPAVLFIAGRALGWIIEGFRRE